MSAPVPVPGKPANDERTTFLGNIWWHLVSEAPAAHQQCPHLVHHSSLSMFVSTFLGGYAMHHGSALPAMPQPAIIDDRLHMAYLDELCAYMLAWFQDQDKANSMLLDPSTLVAFVELLMVPYVHKHGLCAHPLAQAQTQAQADKAGDDVLVKAMGSLSMVS